MSGFENVMSWSYGRISGCPVGNARKGVYRREIGSNMVQNCLKSDVLKHDKTGHL